MGLESVAVLLKTFLRDEYLFETVSAIRATLPEAQMIIVDDGDRISGKKTALYEQLRKEGHVAVLTQFDSGFGFKSNVGIRHCERPFLLIGSDDFNFRPAPVRQGLLDMVQFLENHHEYAIAGGDVVGGGHEGHYEFNLIDEGTKVTEMPIRRDTPRTSRHGIVYHDCDLTRNYVLVRRGILGFEPGQVHWDDDVKIGGGEHGAFFLDVKRAGHRVAFLPKSQISEQFGRPQDSRYSGYRMRASRPQRECFEHRGILEWKHGEGWDYDARNGVPK